jgi:hypothetical protein
VRLSSPNVLNRRRIVQPPKPKAVTLASRMKEARLRTALVLRETISQERMAALVAEALRRPLHQTQWRRYESGESEPPLDVLKAVARVSRVSRDWLTFGDEPDDETRIEPLDKPLPDEDESASSRTTARDAGAGGASRRRRVGGRRGRGGA